MILAQVLYTEMPIQIVFQNKLTASKVFFLKNVIYRKKLEAVAMLELYFLFAICCNKLC